MDYPEKMVRATQSKTEVEDDEDDVEALRLAALKSLHTKHTAHNRQTTLTQVQTVLPQVTQTSRHPYKKQRPIRGGFYHNRMQQRQNGNVYYHSPRNPNLIAIVPVDGPSPLQQIELTYPVKVEKTEQHVTSYPQVSEVSKFHRFKDNGSASEEEDTKEQKGVVTSIKTEIIAKEESNEPLETNSQEGTTESLEKNGEDQKEDGNDDDDDILLMADLEEEDSLERLMDEMEREMNVDKPSEKREKKSNKTENKNAAKSNEENKNFEQRMKSDESLSKKDRYNVTASSLNVIVRGERRSVSPHMTNRVNQKRRSLSPKPRSRKKSPRRSPRRSPIRQQKKSPRDTTRYRSPRRSPSRYSPRSRSPKLSPRRSPNRVSVKRSPPRKLSPRGRSPKFSSRSRSPRPQRSPRRSRSKSPRPRTPKMRSRSPRLSRSRSPRYSPVGLSPLIASPRSKSPRSSPRRMSPRRLPSRSRSPGLSPPRRGSSRLRSPKLSPRRTPPRIRSPRVSPRRSPWSSPRHSPRLSSPRRRRSPKWSPKELPRKRGPRSVTPDNPASLLKFDVKESSPTFKSTATPEVTRTKTKQKEEIYEKPAIIETAKEPADTINDPVLEARRRKFESTRPIDPVNANKKIKLCKKHTASAKTESLIGTEIESNTMRKINRITDEYSIQETELCVETGYKCAEFEGAENTSPDAITSSVNTCIDIEPQQTEKEKPPKKKKKRDKELYQVGKLKNELPLSERIGKDKKCKKRKEVVSDNLNEDVDAILEDITIEEEGDLRTELSRRRAERLNRTVPIQSARLVQSAFKGVVKEVVKNNAKANQRHVINTDEKSNQKEVRRVTVLHRSLTELHDSEDESTLDSKVPVRFRLGLNKQVQESRESKVTRKASKRQGRKVKHKNHLSLKDPEHIL